MSTLRLHYTSPQRTLGTRLTSLLFSYPLKLFIAIVAITCWFTVPSGEVPVPDTPARYAVHLPTTPSVQRVSQRVLTPASPAKYDDALVLSLAPAFSTLDLGPGLRKRTSKRDKTVKWAEERNTLRWGTKWVGLEDEDPGGEHFTVDAIRTRDRYGRLERAFVVETVQEDDGDWLDGDGDVVMADVDSDDDAALA